MSKLSLLFLVAALCLASVLGAEKETLANTDIDVDATSTAQAAIQFQVILGEQKAYYVGDDIIVLLGYTKKVATGCTPTVVLELTPSGVGSALTHARYTTQKRDMTLINTDGAQVFGKKDHYYQAFYYRVKSGDGNAELKNVLYTSTASCHVSGVSTTTTTSKTLSPASITINTIPARVTAITSHQTGKTFTVGGVVDIVVHFDRPVLVEPSSQTNIRLKLNSGGYANYVGFAKASPGLVGDKKLTSQLLFQYIVKSGEAATKLDVLAIELRGNRIVTASSMLEAVAYVQPSATHKSSLQLESIVINRQGYQFPPQAYDANLFPTGVAKPVVPLPLNVGVKINWVQNVNEKDNTWMAEAAVYVNWVDSRLANSLCRESGVCTDATYEIELPYQEVVNKIWNPEIIAVNSNQVFNARKANTQRAFIRNDGRVTLHLRFFQEFADRLNARNFPYEGMLLKHIFRSAKYDSSYITLNADSGLVADAESTLRAMGNNEFHALKAKLSTDTYGDFQTVTATITLKRRALHSNMTIVFPIIFILGMVFCAYYLDVFSEARYIIVALGAFGTLIINYSVLNHIPRTGYVSRLGILLAFNYIHILYTFLFFVILRKVATAVEDYKRIQELKRLKLIAGIHNEVEMKASHTEKEGDKKGDSSSTSTTEKKDVETGAHHEEKCCDKVKIFGLIEVTDANVVNIGESLQTASGATGVVYFVFCVISTAVILAVNISGG